MIKLHKEVNIPVNEKWQDMLVRAFHFDPDLSEQKMMDILIASDLGAESSWNKVMSFRNMLIAIANRRSSL